MTYALQLTTSEQLAPADKVLIATLLIGYYTLLRQGNLLHSEAKDDPGHTLHARDVKITNDGLNVTVWSTKTRWKVGQSYRVLVPPTPGSPYYPVWVVCFSKLGCFHRIIKA